MTETQPSEIGGERQLARNRLGLSKEERPNLSFSTSQSLAREGMAKKRRKKNEEIRKEMPTLQSGRGRATMMMIMITN